MDVYRGIGVARDVLTLILLGIFGLVWLAFRPMTWIVGFILVTALSVAVNGR